MEKGTVYFFTGLSGAGKTTIGGMFSFMKFSPLIRIFTILTRFLYISSKKLSSICWRHVL